MAGAIADSRLDSGTGSRLNELNVWMWSNGKSLPRTISVVETEKIRQKRRVESRVKGADTKRRRRQARAIKYENIFNIVCDIVGVMSYGQIIRVI